MEITSDRLLNVFRSFADILYPLGSPQSILVGTCNFPKAKMASCLMVAEAAAWHATQNIYQCVYGATSAWFL